LNQSKDSLLVERNLDDGVEGRKSFIVILRVAAYLTYTKANSGKINQDIGKGKNGEPILRYYLCYFLFIII
jgi:hypothetical protein